MSLYVWAQKDLFVLRNTILNGKMLKFLLLGSSLQDKCRLFFSVQFSNGSPTDTALSSNFRQPDNYCPKFEY